MKKTTCPICTGKLVEREVAPCYDCGHEPDELDELKRGEHEYFVYRIFEQELVLCDFCDADFGSYYPDYFGLSGKWPRGADYELTRVSTVEAPSVTVDTFCEACQHRSLFLNFLLEARLYNASKR